MKYQPPDHADNQPPWSSLLVVISPQKKHLLDFSWQGQLVTVEVPPTYIGSGQAELELLLGATAPEAHFWRARLPLKLLAARAGLVQYGKNNLTYAPSLGSYHRIFGFYTTIEAPETNWATPRLLEVCTHCSACTTNCPTQCIPNDRFVIHAERCLTTLNELEGDFPSWLPANAHHALVGCMRCQDVCPANSQVLAWQQHAASFDARETEALMTGFEAITASNELCVKLKQLELWGHAELLTRNLRAVLDKPN